MDSDKVLVMDKGSVAEYDTPQRLLSNEQSMFFSLVSNWENSHTDQ
jgi:ATP-binding cassette subfamily C (CFTR/MRP) protein 1